MIASSSVSVNVGAFLTSVTSKIAEIAATTSFLDAFTSGLNLFSSSATTKLTSFASSFNAMLADAAGLFSSSLTSSSFLSSSGFVAGLITPPPDGLLEDFLTVSVPGTYVTSYLSKSASDVASVV